MTHVEESQLLRFTMGQLETEEAASVDAHLRDCSECKQRHDNLSSAAFSKTVPGSSGGGNPTRVDGSGESGGIALQRGAELGHYVLLEKLGAGGMGEVFAAYDPRLDRKVALKLLRSGTLSA